jgi:hypothetical protein
VREGMPARRQSATQADGVLVSCARTWSASGTPISRAEGPVVAGLLVVCGGVVGAREAVMGAGLFVGFPRHAGQGERPAGLPAITSGERDVAEVVQRLDLRGALANGLGHGQTLCKRPEACWYWPCRR